MNVVDNLLPKDKYLWCLHCERVDMRVGWLNNYGYCTYDDCDGSALDAWSWSQVASYNNYPVVPEYDKRYPLYPKEK